jgi:predicted O-methyltransferase YrrM
MKAGKLIEQFLTACQLINHLFRAKHRYGHGIHSPCVYEFVSKILYDSKPYAEYSMLNSIRNELSKSEEQLRVSEIGSISSYFPGEFRKVSKLISISSVNKKFGELLFRISRFYHPATIVELGTSIGMSTLYLAFGFRGSNIITIEANKWLSQYAGGLFEKYQLGNILRIEGLFDEQLDLVAQKYSSPQLLFVDGNHNYEPTIRYYKHFSNRMDAGLMIFDDINWSRGMRKAWNEIKQDPRARVTIDLFYMGIVILDDSITPGHYRIRF